MDADEEDPERMDDPFLAPFSWIVVFVVGALFWYWIVGLLLKLLRSLCPSAGLALRGKFVVAPLRRSPVLTG